VVAAVINGGPSEKVGIMAGDKFLEKISNTKTIKICLKLNFSMLRLGLHYLKEVEPNIFFSLPNITMDIACGIQNMQRIGIVWKLLQREISAKS
jgi:hypothetical protein